MRVRRRARCRARLRHRASDASASSAIAPSCGLVTFWLATAPTPARRWTQREATAGLEEQITMPNAPDSSRADSENVTRCSPVGDHRGGIDLDEPLGPGQGGDHEAGGHRVHALEPASHHPVHRFAIADVDQIHRHLHDVLQRAACLFEQHRDVRHGLLGLCFDVADADRFPGVEILTDLPAQVDHSPCHDGLGEIVVEVLLGIGVAGVERPDADVVAHQRVPRTRSGSSADVLGRDISVHSREGVSGV